MFVFVMVGSRRPTKKGCAIGPRAKASSLATATSVIFCCYGCSHREWSTLVGCEGRLQEHPYHWHVSFRYDPYIP